MLHIICITQIKNSVLAADKRMVQMAALFLKSLTYWVIRRVQVTKLQKQLIFFCIKKGRKYLARFLVQSIRQKLKPLLVLCRK